MKIDQRIMGRINCEKFTKFFVAINENEKKDCLKYFDFIQIYHQSDIIVPTDTINRPNYGGWNCYFLDKRKSISINDR